MRRALSLMWQRCPFPDGVFASVISSLSMHHWDHVDAAVPELARVLRPGGRVLDLRPSICPV